MDKPLALICGLVLVLSLGSGCELSSSSDEESRDSISGHDGNSSLNDQAEPGDDRVSPGLGWYRIAEPPCSPNALWFDQDGAGFLGCGDKTEGHGLWTSSDSGRSWAEVPAFKDLRVNDLRRGPDGVLYGAGQFLAGDSPAFRITEAGGQLGVEALFTWGNSAWTKVAQAENIAVTGDGRVLVDSLTGTTAGYSTPQDGYVELSGLGEESLTDLQACEQDSECGSGVCSQSYECEGLETCCAVAETWQLRKILAFDNRFWGCGSVINDPARVRLPSRLPGATCHLQTLQLQEDHEDGELMDMHIWDGEHMIAAGADNTGEHPLIYVMTGDPYQRESWVKVDLVSQGITWTGAVRSLSVSGDQVVMVGSKWPTTQGGFVILSADRGKTWTDLTPVPESGKPLPFESVWFFPGGEILALGGEAWVYARSEF